MTVKISGPPNVGSGELSRMARKNSPNAPRCRKNLVVLPRRLAAWTKSKNIWNSMRNSVGCDVEKARRIEIWQKLADKRQVQSQVF
jgi:hypothetical protein